MRTIKNNGRTYTYDKKNLDVWLTTEFHAKVKMMAARMGIRANELVNLAVHEKMERLEKKLETV